MHTSFAAEQAGHLSASLHLLGVSVRRLFWSRQTIISILLVGLAALAVFAWARDRQRTLQQIKEPKNQNTTYQADFVEEVLLTVYIPFLLPILCLSYATAGISSDRDEQTLVYLLTSPLPRPFIFAVKALAALILSLSWTLGSLVLITALARRPGLEVLQVAWPAMFWCSVAYVALFQLFSVLFRRATILALGYALFLEALLGNMPGIVKRLAISFYARCLLFDASSDFGIGPSGPFNELLFLPLSGPTAQAVLYCASAGLFLAGLIVFCSREY